MLDEVLHKPRSSREIFPHIIGKINLAIIEMFWVKDKLEMRSSLLQNINVESTLLYCLIFSALSKIVQSEILCFFSKLTTLSKARDGDIFSSRAGFFIMERKLYKRFPLSLCSCSGVSLIGVSPLIFNMPILFTFFCVQQILIFYYNVVLAI